MKSLFRCLAVLPLFLLPNCETDDYSAYGDITPGNLGSSKKKDRDVGHYGHLDDTARFLAGMPGGMGSSYSSLRNTSAWQSHRSAMDQMFNRSVGRHAAVINWSRGELRDINSSLVFYPFSGPDYLYAHSFFPGANRYILSGLEPASALPDLNSLSAGEMSSGLSNLRNSLQSIVNYSYFITKDMRSDLSATRIRGTLPVMLVFMARTGHRIQSITPTSAAGSGFHIVAKGPGGGQKDVYYFQGDVSNSGGNRLLSFVRSQGTPVTYVKSASYLMHRGSFSNIRNGILDMSTAVIQDPSGIPFHYFPERGFKVKLYGSYSGTLDIFKEHYQGDLAAAYTSGRYPVKPIPFGVGYRQTCLIVAKK